MQHVLLVGATGYLGQHLFAQLLAKGFRVSILVRRADRLPQRLLSHENVVSVFERNMRDKHSYADVCSGVDTVISTLGITRQKDGLSYMDVDYQMNKWVLESALVSNVQTFLYVSVLHGDVMRHIKICEAKERFVDLLRASTIRSIVVRPSGFFSDMAEFVTMAKQGRVYLLGSQNYRANPIDGEDLATYCIDALHQNETEHTVGGPEVFTHEQIARLAFDALHQTPRITHIPLWLVRLGVAIAKVMTPASAYGPFEFFVEVMSQEMVGDAIGEKRLKPFFAANAL